MTKISKKDSATEEGGVIQKMGQFSPTGILFYGVNKGRQEKELTLIRGAQLVHLYL